MSYSTLWLLPIAPLCPLCGLKKVFQTGEKQHCKVLLVLTLEMMFLLPHFCQKFSPEPRVGEVETKPC